ncbi:hypothetical protein VTK26DRAFT_3004 [Humicola hyalothermophila]
MSKDIKDQKHKPEGLRQPHRKDSLSSILSWTALQRIPPPRSPTAPSSTTQPHQATPSNGNSASRPRSNSHSAVTDVKKKARRGSTTFRRLSLSIVAATQEGPGTKTRHAKTPPMSQDPKATAGTSKTGKNASASPEKASKKMTQNRPPQAPPYQPRPPGSPVPMPKSILRVSSPDGYKRPRSFVNPETGESNSPGLPPLSPLLSPSSQDSPPGSAPGSPIHRPLSPGATVRFAKATIHRVEVGPGRRFLPVKRKSKSTLTYISPLDPGTQKGAPKTMFQSPTKMRRHQENQAAMGRYWLRTEEEEAQWRADAERRAAEEAERYRNEPSSPPPACDGSRPTLADRIKAIDTLPPRDGKSALDKVEEVIEDSSDSGTDEEGGAKCNPEIERGAAGGNRGGRRPGEESGSGEAKTVSPPTAHATTQPLTAAEAKLAEARSFLERLAEQQAAEKRARRCVSPTPTITSTTSSTAASETSTAASAHKSISKSLRSSISSSSSSSSSSAESLSTSTTTTTSTEKARAANPSNETERKDKQQKAPLSTAARSATNPRSSGSGGGGSRADKPPTTTMTTTSTTTTGRTGRNHLHLSGGRGRRYFESHKQEITA